MAAARVLANGPINDPRFLVLFVLFLFRGCSFHLRHLIPGGIYQPPQTRLDDVSSRMFKQASCPYRFNVKTLIKFHGEVEKTALMTDPYLPMNPANVTKGWRFGMPRRSHRGSKGMYKHLGRGGSPNLDRQRASAVV